VHDVGDAAHRSTNGFAIGNISSYELQSLPRFEPAVVTKSANDDVRVIIVMVMQHAANEMRSDLAGRAGNEDALHRFR
jgi:hypothetical protein